MKILCNDYLANLPQNKWPTKGGPAKFSKLFSKTLVQHKNEWVGLVEKYDGRKINANLVTGTRGKKWWVVSIPKDYLRLNFTQIKKYRDPSKVNSLLIPEIVKIITQEKPDIVFINGCSCFAWAYLRAASFLNIPIVALHAGIWNIEIELYADLFSTAGVKTLKRMEKDFAILPTYNIFLNETSKNYFTKKIHKIPDFKIKIIPLPCENLRTLKKTRVKKDDGQINVGMVARWDRIKNHKAFLNLTKEALINKKDWNFTTVTTIPDTKKDEEFKMEYKKCIKVLKPMDPANLRSFYKKMDFMILPSIFDVSPHVVLEAALEGVPTFISKGVGYKDIFIKNGLEKFIIDFNKPKLAFKEIESMSKNKYPDEFVSFLKKTHNPDIIFRKFELLFKEIIKK